jgi:hypothetical protein
MVASQHAVLQDNSQGDGLFMVFCVDVVGLCSIMQRFGVVGYAAGMLGACVLPSDGLQL